MYTPVICSPRGFALNIVALALIVAQVRGSYVWWSLLGLGAAVNILAFTVLNESFGRAFAGRTNTTLNLLMFGGSFVTQWGIGVAAELARTQGGLDAAGSLRAAFALILAVDVVAFSWFAYGWRRFRVRGAAGACLMAIVASGAIGAYNDGVRHAQAGERAAALAAFAVAASAAPTWPQPWEARGQLLFAAGDIPAAASAFEEALARAPDTVHALANLALCRQRMRQWSRAVAPLERARALAPADEAIWWLARGNLLLLQRDEDALADFLRFAPHARASARFVVAALAAARRMGDAQAEARALAAALQFPYAPGDAASVAELLALVQYFDVAAEALHRLYATYDRVLRAEIGPRSNSLHVPPKVATRASASVTCRRISAGT